MTRNTLTTLGNLTIGCRFYFATDAKKQVWEVRSYSNKKIECITEKMMHPQPYHKNIQVVFLRQNKES